MPRVGEKTSAAQKGGGAASQQKVNRAANAAQPSVKGVSLKALRRPDAVPPNPQHAPFPEALSPEDYRAIGHDIANNLVQIPAWVHVEGLPMGHFPTPVELEDLTRSLIETPNAELTAALGGGLTEIPFKYLKGGCEGRAHIMDQLLDAHGIDNAKIFAIGHLGSANPFFPRGVKWWFHVAPLVVVNEDGHPALRVIDPSIDPHPLRPEAWIAKIDPSRRGVRIEITDRAQYLPEYGSPPTSKRFEDSLPAAQKLMQEDTRLLEGLGSAEDHTQTGTPLTVTDSTVTFRNSSVIYEFEDPAHRQMLLDALKHGRIVKVTSEPHSGRILGVV